MNFAKDIFFKYWDKFDIVIGILGFISLAFDELTWKYKILFVCTGFIIAFIIKLLRQSYNYYENYLKPLKVKGTASGEGSYENLILFKIENVNYISQNTLLTLYCRGTDIFQPICVLEVIRSEFGEDLIAIQLLPSPKDLNINKYITEESRMNSLYVKPIIKTNEGKSLYNKYITENYE